MTPGELITLVQLMFNLPNCYIKAAILYFNLWRLEKAKEMLDEMDKSCTRQEEKLQFDLLIKRIQRLRCDGDKSEDKNYEELTGCIKDHKRILEYCNILRPLISSTIFFQFLVVGVVLGLSFTNLIYFSDLLSGIVNLAYIFGCCCQTFPFCYTCNLLEEDVDRLTLSIFQSNWLSASRRYKVSLVYFLHKAQQPLKFTAGSIFEISLRTNISLAKLAFSVVTFVQKFNLAAKMERE
ncbi:odorant receptor 42b-like [Drosophila nasuta]|uniref:odorant receptor 42b-like n=1 Tax=Drosophila nasuta TaxID=42062 RepID=UPI00295EC46B|nr:odorant receptor 42b-like [Drosophila nasuta]